MTQVNQSNKYYCKVPNRNILLNRFLPKMLGSEQKKTYKINPWLKANLLENKETCLRTEGTESCSHQNRLS